MLQLLTENLATTREVMEAQITLAVSHCWVR
jgi:hypothetical protein